MSRFSGRFLVCAVSAFCLSVAVFAQGNEPTNVTADEALQRLKDGNRRFVESSATHEHQQADRRVKIAKAQNPFAVVVCCSDSRVPPEIVFDQGLGDLFVIRTAGDVVDDVGLGSIEYAVEHLNVPLVVVLGHDRCGAVSATVAGGEVHGHVQAVINAILPALEKVKGQPGDAVANTVRANIYETVKTIRTSGPILSDRVKTGKLTIFGARYNLDDGHVEFFK